MGLFRELPYGSKFGPSVNDYISSASNEDEDKIINYINNGVVFIASPGMVYYIYLINQNV